ncbi:MAG: LysM peptidoglycan-binding domain-containing protein [Pirellulales bacterium]|nr:LysM peptidoglycan-binding domain-containing protein [Pirellulales bacterium]
MSSIRPLATIMLLAVAGFVLYVKITETEPVIPDGVGEYEFNVGLDSGMDEPTAWSPLQGTAPLAAGSGGVPPAFVPSEPSSAPPAWDGGTATTPPPFTNDTAAASTDGPPPFVAAAPSTTPGAEPAAPATQPAMPEIPQEQTSTSAAPAVAAAAGTLAGAGAAAAVMSGDRYGASAPTQGYSTPGDSASSTAEVSTATTDAAAPWSDVATEAPEATPPAGDLGRYADAAVASAPASVDTPASSTGSLYAQSRRSIQSALDRGELAQALQMLSDWQGDPSLTRDESAEVEGLLSQLAGSVIYSTEHRLEPPYLVQAGETIDGIAAKYDVSPQLLGKINGVAPGQPLAPGQELKVVRGPFSALIDLSDRELTLMLDRRYAGRFRVQIDPALTVEDGQWEVVDKPLAPASAAPNVPHPPADGVDRSVMLQNPTALSGQVAVLRGPGVPDAASPEPAGRVIRLDSPDIEDVFDILSVGSRITIRR